MKTIIYGLLIAAGIIFAHKNLTWKNNNICGVKTEQDGTSIAAKINWKGCYK